MTNTWPIARGRVSEREAFAFASTILFIVFAGDGVSNLLSYVGWGLACGLGGIWGITILVRARPSLSRTPRTLWILLGWCLVSTIWSHWRLATVSSLAVQVLCVLMAFVVASTLSWRRIVDAIGLALRWVVLLSLVLELVVAVVVRHPVYPVWTDYGGKKVPAAFAFSRAELFTGGQIQGLPGNSNLLAMVALLAVVLVALQWAEGRVRRNRAVGWLVLGALTLGLTRSSTVLAAGVVVVLVLLFALFVRSAPSRRGPRYLLGAIVGVVVVVLVAVLRTPLLHALGKSTDLTGRGNIWAKVWELTEQHPVVGWGWIGYWWPASRPLGTLYSQHGVTYLQAHDAYLDIWMQLGIVGLVIFAIYVLTTLRRTWACATRVAYDEDQSPIAFSPVTLAPLLVTTALLVQSLTESRLLYEGNWILFAVLAIKSRNVLIGEEPRSVGDGPRLPQAARAFRWPAPRA